MDDNAVPTLIGDLMEHRVSRRDFVRRALAVGLSVPAVSTLLAACEQQSGTPAASGDLKGKVQIMVGYFGTGNSPSQIPVQDALAGAFEKLNPDVEIEFLRVTADAKTKLVTLVAGGTAPDIILPTGIFGIAQLVDQDMWLDLSELFERDDLSLDAFRPEVVQSVRVANYYGANSKAIIGVPIGIHDHVLAYNEEVVSKAEITAPPTSWSDDAWTYTGKLLETAKALTVDSKGRHPGDAGFDAKAIDRYGLGHFFRETIFFAWGGRHYDRDGRKAAYDTQASIDGLQFAADLVNKHHVQPSQTEVASLGAGAPKGQEEQFAWKSGKLAMVDMCSCDIRGGFGTDVTFPWKAAAVPAGPARRFTFLNLDVGAIVAKTRNRDVAWEVLKFFTLDPATEKRLATESYAAFAPLKRNFDVFATGIRKDLPKVEPQVWIDGLAHASTDAEAWFPAFAQVNDLAGPAFDKIIAGEPAAATMKALQGQAQAKIEEWFKSNKLEY